jgi:hypothetical protein
MEEMLKVELGKVYGPFE